MNKHANYKEVTYFSFSEVISKVILSLCFTYKLTGVIRFPSLDLVDGVDNNDKSYPVEEKHIFLNTLCCFARFSHIQKI
jgi:hypothetical protein